MGRLCLVSENPVSLKSFTQENLSLRLCSGACSQPRLGLLKITGRARRLIIYSFPAGRFERPSVSEYLVHQEAYSAGRTSFSCGVGLPRR